MTAPPPVATTVRTAGSGSAGPEVGRPPARSRARNAASPSLGEDLRDRPAGRLLDRLVEVDERRAVAMGEPPPDGALAAAGQPDEDDVHLGASVVAAGAGLVAVGGRAAPATARRRPRPAPGSSAEIRST